MPDEMQHTDPHECVFCTRRDQPAILAETPSLYVMPDKYPLVPGHVLIIARNHLRCYAMAGDDVWRELVQLTGWVRQFLAEMYRRPVTVLENGIDGQTVYHAHLHLYPLGLREFPSSVLEHPDVALAGDWRSSVQDLLAQRNGYRYVEVDGKRYTIAPASPVLPDLRTVLAGATGLRWDGKDWVRTTGPADIEALHRRWKQWAAVTNPADELASFEQTAG